MTFSKVSNYNLPTLNLESRTISFYICHGLAGYCSGHVHSSTILNYRLSEIFIEIIPIPDIHFHTIIFPIR